MTAAFPPAVKQIRVAMSHWTRKMNYKPLLIPLLGIQREAWQLCYILHMIKSLLLLQRRREGRKGGGVGGLQGGRVFEQLGLRTWDLEVPSSSAPLTTSAVLGSSWFSSSADVVNGQLVCLLPAGILNSVVFIWIICFIVREKPLKGEWLVKYLFYLFVALIKTNRLLQFAAFIPYEIIKIKFLLFCIRSGSSTKMLRRKSSPTSSYVSGRNEFTVFTDLNSVRKFSWRLGRRPGEVLSFSSDMAPHLKFQVYLLI